MGNGSQGRKLISVFQELSASIIKNFILSGRLSTRQLYLWRLDTMLIFPNFLRSLVLSCSAHPKY